MHELGRTTREGLGRPIFQDPKTAHEIMQLVSNMIGEGAGGKAIGGEMAKGLDGLRKEGLPITAASIALRTCLNRSWEMQGLALLKLKLAGQNGDRDGQIAAAVLDVTRGLQEVMLGLQEYEDMDIEESLETAKFLAKFWNSPDRIVDGEIKSYEDQEFIGQGAKLGAKTYKRMHRIAKNFLSSIIESALIDKKA